MDRLDSVWLGGIPSKTEPDLLIAGLYQFSPIVEDFFLQPADAGSKTWATARLASAQDAQTAIQAGQIEIGGLTISIRPRTRRAPSPPLNPLGAPLPVHNQVVAIPQPPVFGLPRIPRPAPVDPSPAIPLQYPPGFCNHVFWDFDNIPIAFKPLVTPFIRNMERIFGPIHRPITAVGNARTVSDDVTHQLTLENVELQHLAGVKEMADRALESKIQSFLANAKPNEHIVLITADGDFSRPLASKKWERRVILIKSNKKHVNPALIDRAFPENIFDIEVLTSPDASRIGPLPVPSSAQDGGASFAPPSPPKQQNVFSGGGSSSSVGSRTPSPPPPPPRPILRQDDAPRAPNPRTIRFEPEPPSPPPSRPHDPREFPPHPAAPLSPSVKMLMEAMHVSQQESEFYLDMAGGDVAQAICFVEQHTN